MRFLLEEVDFYASGGYSSISVSPIGLASYKYNWTLDGGIYSQIPKRSPSHSSSKSLVYSIALF